MTRVVSCRFLRLSCSEDEHPLFRRYYARSNRERGIKLLRCFPHCCPEHVERCYCGTSIHVQVTFATTLLPDVLNSLLVCARFEPSKVVPLWPTTIVDASDDDVAQMNERKLQPGEVVTLPASLLATEKRKSNHMVWIRADKQNEAKLKTLPQNAVLYVLNNHRFPKWQYSYDSSVTRTQREMTHHLVVYVFRLLGCKSESGMVKGAVLARHESPEFSLFSHRRSGTSFRDLGIDHHAADTASSSSFAALDVDVSAIPSTYNEIKPDLCKQSTSQISDSENKIATGLAQRTAFDPSQSASTSADTNTAFWAFDVRAHQTGVAEKAKHLMILWRFFSHVNLFDIGMTSDVLHAQIRSHWLQAAKALRASPETRTSHLEGVMGSFLLSLCRTQIYAPNRTAKREQLVVQAAVHLFLRALSSRATHYSLQLAFTPELCGLDKHRIRERFIVLVLELYDILGDLFGLASTYADSVFQNATNVPSLVDEVLSLIYNQQQFVDLRSEVTRLLRGELASGGQQGVTERLFDIFTAQMEESIFAAGLDSNGPGPSSQLTGLVRSSWTRTWILEPSSFQVTSIPQEDKVFVKPSLVEFSRWIYEFACIEVAINGSVLAVRSLLPIIGGMGPTLFQLDGRLRSFRSTPGGQSSRIPTPCGWSVGDYAGSFSDQTNTLEMNFYALKGDTLDIISDDQAHQNGQIKISTTVCRVSMSFVLEEHLKVEDLSATVDLKDRFILIRGIVAQATYMDLRSLSFRYQFADMSSASRSDILRELPWVTDLEVQGGYVAVPS